MFNIGEYEMSQTGIVIPFSTADSITVENLINSRDSIEMDIFSHEVNGTYLHPEDYKRYKKLVKSIDRLLNYYGSMEL